MIYGTAWKEGATKGLVLKALEAGFTAIDTANQPKHYSEAGVGEALKAYFKTGGRREALFIQTKFTPADGHDSRIPYDPSRALGEQVRQSFDSSLKNLGLDYVDSYLLHSPYGHPDIGDEDLEVWAAFERILASGKARSIGVSNINALQLAQLAERAQTPPMAVQNRCYASRGWDRDVRAVCRSRKIAYQGFSLLTANMQVLAHPRVAASAAKHGKTPAQVVFRFAIQAGMTPLTGTSDEDHMREDLAVDGFALTPAEVELVESLGLRK
jgi:diketogulonate reductase-like aldo/keto reductase